MEVLAQHSKKRRRRRAIRRQSRRCVVTVSRVTAGWREDEINRCGMAMDGHNADAALGG